MKKAIKAGVLVCLMCSLLSSLALAGNSPVSRYNIPSSGLTTWWYVAPGSSNTKATTKANWFMNINMLDFNGGSTSGTLGMAYTPTQNEKQAGGIHWSKTTHSNYVYTGWDSYNGAAGNTYLMGCRLDTLITGVKEAKTTGWWNSN